MNRKLAALEMLMKCNLGELGEIKIWITQILEEDDD